MRDDFQRFARTEARWVQPTHNQLFYTRAQGPAIEAVVTVDMSMRKMAEVRRRDTQRDLCIEDLVEEAMKGNITSLFHLTKHKSVKGDIVECEKMAEDYRSRIGLHSILSHERVWIALAVAFRHYRDDEFEKAEMWACRALLDGPNTTAFCLLGDIAEDQGDLKRALGWYECAVAQSIPDRMEWPGLTSLRYGRHAALKIAVVDPEAAPLVEIVDGVAQDAVSATAEAD
jgi:hypothetical protein